MGASGHPDSLQHNFALDTPPDWYSEPVGSDIEETLSDVAHVSRILHAVKNPGDLDAEGLCEVCVCLFNAERRLTAMLEAERGAH